MEEQSLAPKQISFLSSLENTCLQNGTPATSKHSKSNKTMEEVLVEVEKVMHIFLILFPKSIFFATSETNPGVFFFFFIVHR